MPMILILACCTILFARPWFKWGYYYFWFYGLMVKCVLTLCPWFIDCMGLQSKMFSTVMPIIWSIGILHKIRLWYWYNKIFFNFYLEISLSAASLIGCLVQFAVKSFKTEVEQCQIPSLLTHTTCNIY